MNGLLKIKGVMYDSECFKLHALAENSEYPVLNIGSYCGKSTAFLASGTKQKVYAIDLWDLRAVDYEPTENDKRRGYHQRASYEAFVANMRKYGLTNVIPVKGDSREIGKVWNMPLGALFIDGDHRFDWVKSDYDLFGKFIVPGGYLALHDIVIGYVQRLVDEVIAPSGLWTDIEIVETLWVARRKE